MSRVALDVVSIGALVLLAGLLVGGGCSCGGSAFAVDAGDVVHVDAGDVVDAPELDAGDVVYVDAPARCCVLVPPCCITVGAPDCYWLTDAAADASTCELGQCTGAVGSCTP